MDPLGDVFELLQEWYWWWSVTDDAPAKMPNALHVRTALALMTRGVDPVTRGGPFHFGDR